VGAFDWKLFCDISNEDKRHAFCVKVLNVSIDDWQKLHQFLIHRGNVYKHRPISYAAGREWIEPPEDVRQALRTEDCHYLVVDLDGIRVDCPFYADDEIELHLWSETVGSEHKFTEFITFVESIAELLDKKVFITDYDDDSRIYFSCRPGE